jgi:hypothetical protein
LITCARMIRHTFDFDIGRGELIVSTPGILGSQQLRLTNIIGRHLHWQPLFFF